MLDVHPVGADAHQQIGAGAGAELASAGGQGLLGDAGEVVGEGGDGQLEIALERVGLGHHLAQPGLWSMVIGPVHHQQGVVRTEVPVELLDEGVQPAHQGLGVIGERGAVPVPGHQVLGPHRGAVRGLPPEGGVVHRGRDTAPHHGVLEARLRQDLGHLGDVPEHVG